MWRIKRHALALFITVLSFVLVPAAGHCQERVTNVRAEQQGNQVFIYYDLTGHEGKYQVKVRGSSNGGKDFDLPMKSVSGDIGKGIRPGRGKTIIWDATRDIRQLYGDNFVFEVEATGAEKKRFTNSVGMKFVYIKPGTFMMGSPSSEKGRDSDETWHKVTLTKGFYMQTTEVTQGQWKAIMGNNPSYFKNCGDDCPVGDVSWNDVQEFIRKLNRMEGTNKYRLPTEAEWEYACRAGSEDALYTGPIRILGKNNAPALDEIAWYGGNSCVDYNGGCDCSGWSEKQYSCSRCGTHPVGGKKPNAWGLYDMIGNVWEWCQDWYGDYPRGHVTDPAGPSSGSYRVYRGGSWYGDARYCRSARRYNNSPGFRYIDLGFRLARTK
ncbi:MAG: hypothetical protein DRH17_08070 [Deltaproteobacteria bacterium]|nr:MAG: hypothetical protein DRH17_08070 [Deltaproteobacteria bacterium]